MPPRLARRDDYADDRCSCNHLVYPDDTPGGECRFCPCIDHQSANRPGPDVLHDQDDRFERHGVSGWDGGDAA